MKLKIDVTDASGSSIFCKIIIEKGNAPAEPLVVYCGGKYETELDEGKYRVTVTKGKLFTPYKGSIEAGNEDIELFVTMEELLDTKGLGLYSFDAHSHVSRDEVLDTGDLVSASAVMKGEDFNLFFAGSPYDHEVHLQYLNRNFTDKVSYREKFADVIRQVGSESYILDIGNEIVKCRYGHAFMVNYEQKPPFSKYYDEDYDLWCFNKVGEEPPYRITYMHEALLSERGSGSAAVAAHPTSWWWHTNGEFVTNIAASLGFEILAGSVDAMVVMGYERDHRHYQELWFDALKNGCFLPGTAETDAAFDTPPRRHLEFKTYAIAGEFSIDAVARAVREGRCIVTSGPVVLLKVNGRDPGSVLRYEKGDSFDVGIDAYACCEAALSKIQLIIDGNICKEYIVDGVRAGITESIKAEKDCFVLVKCYDRAGNLAMTNPVYIRNAPFLNDGYEARVRVNAKRGGEAVKGEYWVEDIKAAGECGDSSPVDGSHTKTSFDGSFTFSMPPAAKLMVQAGEQLKTLRLFELPELQAIFARLYSGAFNSDRRYRPGEVPAAEFRLGRIREILDNAEISLDF